MVKNLFPLNQPLEPTTICPTWEQRGWLRIYNHFCNNFLNNFYVLHLMKKFSFLMYLQFPGVIELPLHRLPFSLIEGTKNIFLVELSSFWYSLFLSQISMDFCVGFSFISFTFFCSKLTFLLLLMYSRSLSFHTQMSVDAKINRKAFLFHWEFDYIQQNKKWSWPTSI